MLMFELQSCEKTRLQTLVKFLKKLKILVSNPSSIKSNNDNHYRNGNAGAIGEVSIVRVSIF